jgi:hypothetical protein
MGTTNYSVYSAEEVAQFFIKMNPEEVQTEIAFLPIEQIAFCLLTINETTDPQWQRKIGAIFSGLNQREQIQACGKTINQIQMLEILNFVRILDSSHQWKLPPLLVGLPHRVFEEVLMTASDEQLQILKHEGITEPIQHHLTILLHEWAKDIGNQSTLLHDLLKEISHLGINQITRNYINDIQNMLLSTSGYYHYMIDKVNRALAIAWNTNRADLIEKFTSLKDSCLKYNVVVIGHPFSKDEHSTGLYGLLDERLNIVYGASETNSDVALDNDDPAIEGLAKLGIWYVHDYWEMGLLPKKNEPLDPESIDEREELSSKVIQNLEKLGLKTVLDLKRAGIYSKEILKDFIELNKHLTSP